MKTGLCTDERFRDHRPPDGHPERPERLLAIEAALERSGLPARCVRIAPREATRVELERVHEAAYLDELFTRLDGGEGWLDPDTYYSAGSRTAALLAAGSAVELASAVADGTLDDGIAFVRPPGHHATADRAMGFCLLNNVAVAAGALRARGLRVAIVDFDVHHGNGTEAIFWDDPNVLYASTHQYPFYPGTGAAGAQGGPGAVGATVNVPLPAGAGDAALLAAYRQVIFPSLVRFAPDLTLLSAGFDAHARDPLASLRVSEAGFGRLMHELRDVARGRLAAVLEGGYDLEALGRSAVAATRALLGDPPPEIAADGPLTDEERRFIERAAARLAGPAPTAPRASSPGMAAERPW